MEIFRLREPEQEGLGRLFESSEGIALPVIWVWEAKISQNLSNNVSTLYKNSFPVSLATHQPRILLIDRSSQASSSSKLEIAG